MHQSEGRGELAARLGELNALYVLTDRLYRAKSIHEAFEAGLDAIRDGLGCQRASMLLFDEAGVFAAPAFPLREVQDPTGAGDSFAGGLLFGPHPVL